MRHLLPLLAACAARSGLESPPDSAAVTLLGGCAPPATHFVLAGGTVVGTGLADVEVEDGRIVAVGTVASGLPQVDVSGAFLAPAFIDSHVHLAYVRAAEAFPPGGVAGVVDLAAPTSFLEEDHGSLRVLASGPMVTAVGGYPTQSWGRGGYGLECADADAAVAAVDTLKAAGAGVIKLPVTSAPVLEPDALAAAAARAHALGLPVVSHALADAEAAEAAAAGVDVLAHTPTGVLSSETIAAWSGRAVISTLGAFGGTSTTVANLAALHAGGTTVLYGTDFGNTRTAGVDAGELALMLEAGMTPAEVLAAGTSVPAEYWGFDELGEIAPGKAASLLVLPRDPLGDPTVLASPTAVYIDGVRTGG